MTDPARALLTEAIHARQEPDDPCVLGDWHYCEERSDEIMDSEPGARLLAALRTGLQEIACSQCSTPTPLVDVTWPGGPFLCPVCPACQRHLDDLYGGSAALDERVPR